MTDCAEVLCQRAKHSIGMWRLVIAVASLGFAFEAVAGDWTVKSKVSQGLEVNDNRRLLPDSEGTSVETISRLTIDAVRTTPRWRFTTAGYVSYRWLGGSGDQLGTALDNGVRLKAETFDHLTTYYLLTSWRLRDAVSAQVEDVGISNASGFVNTLYAEAGLDRQLSRDDVFSWSFRGTYVGFTDSSGSSFADFLSIARLTKRLNSLTDVFYIGELEYIDRDDVFDTQSYFARGFAGLSTKLSKRLEFKGKVGVGWVGIDQKDVASQAVSSINRRSNTNSRFNFVSDVTLTWRPYETTTIDFFAGRNLTPSELGEIQTRTNVGFSIDTSVNFRSNVYLRSEFVAQDFIGESSVGGEADLYRLTVGYDYRWSEDWTTRLSYKYTNRVDGSDTADSNAVFFHVAKDLKSPGQ